jgi:hypothetical protein
MYNYTIEGLFEVAATGTLVEVEEIVKCGKVDVNQLHNNKHIINDLLERRYLQFEEKIFCLINAGAIPQFDDEFNIPFILTKLNNIDLQKKLVALIKETEGFKDKYSQYHFAAIEGIAPKTSDEAFKIDHFGLYPIHYAIIKGIANKSWFDTIAYDFVTPIKNGLYEGINLFWFLISAGNKIYRDIRPDNAGWSSEKSFQLLKSAPLNSNHPSYSYTVARNLLDTGEYDVFTRLTQHLSPEQCHEILLSAPLDPNDEYYGETIALLLLFEEEDNSFDDFTRLTQHLSPEQCLEILKSAPLNPDNTNYGLTVAQQLLCNNRFDDFTRLTQNLSPEQSYEILKSASFDPNDLSYGEPVVHLLLEKERYNDFFRLIQDLSLKQFYELLRLYEELEKKGDAYYAMCYVLLEKINTALHNLMQSTLDKKEEVEGKIQDYLKALLQNYEQLAANQKYRKKVSELVGITISQACMSIYRNIFEEYLESILNYDYLGMKENDPKYALEGYGFYLRILDNDNVDLARQRGVEFARAKSGKDKLQKTSEMLGPDSSSIKPPSQLPAISSEPDESNERLSLKRTKSVNDENEEKHTKTATLALLPSDSEDEINKKPRTTGGDPRLFSANNNPKSPLFDLTQLTNTNLSSRKGIADQSIQLRGGSSKINIL